MTSFLSHSADETLAFGRKLGEQLPANSVVCLMGDLGTGKTVMMKGLVSGAAQVPVEQVQSPTFVYLNIYQGRMPVYHFDLYRLRDADEFLSMGFDEYFSLGGVCCIEWSERILPIIPTTALKISLQYAGKTSRLITVTPEVVL